MTADVVLSRLHGVKQTGPGRWLAKCPAHEDKRPSLSIRETDSGVVLLKDFGGCDIDSVVGAIGLTVGDLFPEKLRDGVYVTPRAPRIPASDVLRAVAHEIFVVACAASDLAAERPLKDEDRARLSLAVQRLSSAVEVANGKH